MRDWCGCGRLVVVWCSCTNVIRWAALFVFARLLQEEDSGLYILPASGADSPVITGAKLLPPLDWKLVQPGSGEVVTAWETYPVSGFRIRRDSSSHVS
jgi:hypothetical protein